MEVPSYSASTFTMSSSTAGTKVAACSLADSSAKEHRTRNLTYSL